MAVYRSGAVVLRIDEAKMRKYMKERADLAAARGAYATANHARDAVRQAALINKGVLLNSISVQKGGTGRNIGAWYRVFTDVSSSPYAGMHHSGSGPIYPKNGKLLFLQYRKNSGRKARTSGGTAWTAKSTTGYAAVPFMKIGASRLKISELTNGMPSSKPISKSKQPAAKVGGFSAALKSGALKGGRY